MRKHEKVLESMRKYEKVFESVLKVEEVFLNANRKKKNIFIA